jgi:hypothetical protein
MIHYYVDGGDDHWAVTHNGLGKILVQIESGGVQSRIAISPETAYSFSKLLQTYADEAFRYNTLKRLEEETGSKVEVIRTYKPDVIRFD